MTAAAVVLIPQAWRRCAPAWAELLRLTGATLYRLFKQAEASVERVQLSRERLPTLIELEAVLRVLQTGGLFVLTVPKSLGDKARELVRHIVGFSPHEAAPKTARAQERTNVTRCHGQRNALNHTRRAPTVDIFVRKGELAPLVQPALPAVRAPRQSGLRYFGGKTRATGSTLPYLPEAGVIVAPFCGGLSVELEASARGSTIRASDQNSDVIDLWQVVKGQRPAFVKECVRLYDQFEIAETRADWYYNLRNLRYPALIDPVERAAAYFALLRTAMFGSVLAGFGTGNRFTLNSIRRIASLDLSRIEFEQADFRDVIDGTDDFLYLDPPFMEIDSIYIGEPWTAADHLDLFDRIRDRSRWILHCGDCASVRALYDGFPMVEFESWNGSTKTMGRQLIILPRAPP